MTKPLLTLSIIASSSVLAQDSLTIYTYDSFASEWGPGPAVEKAFETQCDCDLNFVALDDGVSILNRLKLEGKNTKADIILGLDDSLIAEAKTTGLLEKTEVDFSELAVPTGWEDDTFVPFDFGYFAFVYNKSKLENPPKSLKELVEQRDDIKVIYQDPRTSTPGQGFLFWMKSVYGDDAAQAWSQLASKTVTVTKGWSEAYSMFLKGESDMVLSYTTSPAYHLIAESDDNYATASFEEGHYLQVEVAARLNTSSQPELAQQFLEFMLTDEFQTIIPTGNWMYPATNIDLPEGFETLSTPENALSFEQEAVTSNRKTWIREWQNALAK
ncbi:thiamine ABC transporter substrate binding subunit [Vibrio sp. RC27]